VNFVVISWLVGARPRGRPNRIWKEVVDGDVKSLKINREDALIHSKWRRLIRSTEGDSDDSARLMRQIVFLVRQ